MRNDITAKQTQCNTHFSLSHTKWCSATTKYEALSHLIPMLSLTVNTITYMQVLCSELSKKNTMLKSWNQLILFLARVPHPWQLTTPVRITGPSKLTKSLSCSPPVRKIGEKCSNPGDSGVCAAIHSNCSEETGRCVCEEGYVPIWGGERCAPVQSTSAGETCSDSIGECELDSSQCRAEATDSFWYDVVSDNVPTCACRNSERLVLMNHHVNNHEIVNFPSKKYPVCTAGELFECILLEMCG